MKNRNFKAILLVLMIVCIVNAVGAATNALPDPTYRPWTEIWANDGGNGQYLGNAVAIAGETAVVANRVPNGFGAVYVFVHSAGGWSQQAKLMSDDEAMSDDFGYSVAISGDYIVVGAPSARPNGDPYRGAAYVFFRTGTSWSQQAKLVASDGAGMDGFGTSVAISRDQFAVVGSPNHAVGANAQQGAAYIYTRGGTTWSEQEFTRSNGAAGDRFGFSVAMVGFDAVISAPFRDVNGNIDQGQAYVYEVFGVVWTAIATLTAPDGAANQYFGQTVTMSTISLGSVTIACSSPNADKVYIFQKSANTFLYQATITSPPSLGFTDVIALGTNSLFVGNSSASHNGVQTGIVFQYNRVGTTWSQFPDLYPTNGANFDHFGMAVAASGDYVIVTAPWADVGSSLDQGAAYLFLAARTKSCDFDGDGKTDISLFRPGSSQWWYQLSSSGRNLAFQFGTSTDVVAPADLTGDGKTDAALFRPSTGEWLVLRSDDFTYYGFAFGQSGDKPVPADYDGDGIADPAVFRPSTNVWYIWRSSDGQATITPFGAAGDQPVQADYDGDGKADLAIYRPNGGTGAEWWIQRSTLGLIVFQFGLSSDKVVTGDFTGDGKSDCAIYRPSTGQWFVLRSDDLSYYAFPFGAAGDIPTPGDYDGDNKTDAAVFRPSTGIWYVNGSSAGVSITQFGGSGDIPLPSAYVR